MQTSRGQKTPKYVELFNHQAVGKAIIHEMLKKPDYYCGFLAWIIIFPTAAWTPSETLAL